MIQKVIGVKQVYDKIIIESQSDITALWGELLAEKLKAKHVCFICNERFKGLDKHYEENIDYFDFKHRRQELAGIHSNSLKKLFDGYKNVSDEESYRFYAANSDPVQDVENSIIKELEKKDWNICYIGRATKGYVPIIIEDISKFAYRYPKKTIQVIFVGDQSVRESLIAEKLRTVENVNVVLLGDLVPIPKSLFKKIDVMIAGAGCAVISAQEGVPTIVADAGDYLANGLLGYTTHNSLYREEGNLPMHYDEVLEQVLVHHVTDTLIYMFRKKKDPHDQYAQHMKFICQSAQEKVYYNLNEEIKKIKAIELFKHYIEKWFPNLVRKYVKIKKELVIKK